MILNHKEAKKELATGEKMNPGLWGQHSISVANNAKLIADRVSDLDSNKAYVMGLMHDIGRRSGIKGLMHTLDGYNYMMSINQPEIARICLKHSFPIKDIHTFFGKQDCTDGQISDENSIATTFYYDCDWSWSNRPSENWMHQCNNWNSH